MYMESVSGIFEHLVKVCSFPETMCENNLQVCIPQESEPNKLTFIAELINGGIKNKMVCVFCEECPYGLKFLLWKGPFGVFFARYSGMQRASRAISLLSHYDGSRRWVITMAFQNHTCFWPRFLSLALHFTC